MTDREREGSMTTDRDREAAVLRAAHWIWGDRYSKQSLSLVDWFKTLSDYDKNLARQCVAELSDPLVARAGEGRTDGD